MKITLATLKSFIRKNAGSLYIQNESDFDGMVDCVMPSHDKSWSPVETTSDVVNKLGIKGAWIVGSGRNFITALDKDGYIGYHVFNCCGSFSLAIKK